MALQPRGPTDRGSLPELDVALVLFLSGPLAFATALLTGGDAAGFTVFVACGALMIRSAHVRGQIVCPRCEKKMGSIDLGSGLHQYNGFSPRCMNCSFPDSPPDTPSRQT